MLVPEVYYLFSTSIWNNLLAKSIEKDEIL
jgi:hypothetical protein